MKELVISLLVLAVLATAVISGSMRSIGEPTKALATSSSAEPPSDTEEDSSDDDSD